MKGMKNAEGSSLRGVNGMGTLVQGENKER